MAKINGIPLQVQVDDGGGSLQDISCDITNLTFNTSRGEQNVTGLCKSAMERLMLLADGQVTLNGVFNPSANQSHAVLKTTASTTAQRTVTITITSSGDSISMEMLFSSYDITRSAAGELTWSAKAVLADGTIPTWS